MPGIKDDVRHLFLEAVMLIILLDSVFKFDNLDELSIVNCSQLEESEREDIYKKLRRRMPYVLEVACLEGRGLSDVGTYWPTGFYTLEAAAVAKDRITDGWVRQLAGDNAARADLRDLEMQNFPDEAAAADGERTRSIQLKPGKAVVDDTAGDRKLIDFLRELGQLHRVAAGQPTASRDGSRDLQDLYRRWQESAYARPRQFYRASLGMPNQNGDVITTSNTTGPLNGEVDVAGERLRQAELAAQLHSSPRLVGEVSVSSTATEDVQGIQDAPAAVSPRPPRRARSAPAES